MAESRAAQYEIDRTDDAAPLQSNAELDDGSKF